MQPTARKKKKVAKKGPFREVDKFQTWHQKKSFKQARGGGKKNAEFRPESAIRSRIRGTTEKVWYKAHLQPA